MALRLAALVVFAAALVGLGFWWRSAQDGRERAGTTRMRHVPDKRAEELYIEGRYLWAKHSPDPVHESILRFQQAIRLDPNYALPYSGLADAYAITASGLPAQERSAQAKSYAERALAIDPSSAEAETSLAFILYKFGWNWPEAERRFRRALQLDPSYALAHHWFGEFLVLRGRPDQGLAELRQALVLEPLALSTQNDLARALYRTRHYGEAIRRHSTYLALIQRSTGIPC